jgi:hypothetical protein
LGNLATKTPDRHINFAILGKKNKTFHHLVIFPKKYIYCLVLMEAFSSIGPTRAWIIYYIDKID